MPILRQEAERLRDFIWNEDISISNNLASTRICWKGDWYTIRIPSKKPLTQETARKLIDKQIDAIILVMSRYAHEDVKTLRYNEKTHMLHRTFEKQDGGHRKQASRDNHVDFLNVEKADRKVIDIKKLKASLAETVQKKLRRKEALEPEKGEKVEEGKKKVLERQLQKTIDKRDRIQRTIDYAKLFKSSQIHFQSIEGNEEQTLSKSSSREKKKEKTDGERPRTISRVDSSAPRGSQEIGASSPVEILPSLNEELRRTQEQIGILQKESEKLRDADEQKRLLIEGLTKKLEEKDREIAEYKANQEAEKEDAKNLYEQRIQELLKSKEELENQLKENAIATEKERQEFLDQAGSLIGDIRKVFSEVAYKSQTTQPKEFTPSVEKEKDKIPRTDHKQALNEEMAKILAMVRDNASLLVEEREKNQQLEQEIQALKAKLEEMEPGEAPHLLKDLEKLKEAVSKLAAKFKDSKNKIKQLNLQEEVLKGKLNEILSEKEKLKQKLEEQVALLEQQSQEYQRLLREIQERTDTSDAEHQKVEQDLKAKIQETEKEKERFVNLIKEMIEDSELQDLINKSKKKVKEAGTAADQPIPNQTLPAGRDKTSTSKLDREKEANHRRQLNEAMAAILEDVKQTTALLIEQNEENQKLLEEINRLKDQLAKAEKNSDEFGQLSKQLALLNAQFENNQLKIKELEKQKETLLEEKQKLEEKLSESDGQWKRKLDEARYKAAEELKKTTKSMEDLQEKMESLSMENESLKKKIRRLKGELKLRKALEQPASKQDLPVENLMLEEEIRKIQESKEELLQNLASKEETLIHLETQNHRLEELLKESHVEKRKSEASLAYLKNKLGDASAKNQKVAESLEEQKEQLRINELVIKDRETQIKDLHSDLKKQKKRSEELKTALELEKNTYLAKLQEYKKLSSDYKLLTKKFNKHEELIHSLENNIQQLELALTEKDAAVAATYGKFVEILQVEKNKIAKLEETLKEQDSFKSTLEGERGTIESMKSYAERLIEAGNELAKREDALGGVERKEFEQILQQQSPSDEKTSSENPS
jgi:hypothetical protein